jgi:hypothetical protein
MRTAISTFFAFFITIASLQAQMAEPVNWSFSAEKLTDKEYEVKIIANIEDGWYVYSQEMKPVGPIPTKIDFELNPNIVLDGKPQEIGKKKEVYDANFQINVIKLEGKTQFVQRVKLVGNTPSVKGQLLFMTCNGESCLPPQEIKFDVPLKH